MFGLIGKMSAVAGQRDALAELMLSGVRDMPGCLSYVVALDPEDPDAIWVTEVWTSREHHRESLSIPAVKEVISRAMPLIAGFGQHTETKPVGGVGIG